MNTLAVNEVFVSIQGETSWCGYPCCFVRLAGCNLRCRYCDTVRAQSEQGVAMTVSALTEVCRTRMTPLIAVTGGEPLRQSLFGDLVESLLTLPTMAVLVETNGSLDINCIPPKAITIMDIKCPGSGETKAMDWNNLERLRAHDEVKFILTDRTDYCFALDIVRTHRLDTRCRHVHFAPAAPHLEATVLAQWLIADRPPVRLQTQLHRQLQLP